MCTTISLFCLFGLLVSLVFSVPTTSHQVQKGSFKVESVRNPHYVSHQNHSVIQELYKAHIRYGRRLPHGLLDSMDLNTRAVGAKLNGAARGAKQKSQVIANVESISTGRDAINLSPVNIGGQTFMMELDTGTADLWVANTHLSDENKSLLPHGAVLFDPSKSSTFRMIKDAKFKLTSFDGNAAAGIVGKDTVNIGGATVPQQAVQLPTMLSRSVLQQSSSGSVGLAFSSLSKSMPQQKSFLDNIAPYLNEPVFTASLRHDAPGFYEFGAIDKTKFSGELQYAPVVDKSSGRWLVSSTNFSVGGTESSSEISTAVIDTGASMIFVGIRAIDAYYSTVPHASTELETNLIVIPCNSRLPDIKLSVGDKFATISGETLNFGPACEGCGMCYGGLQLVEALGGSSEKHMVFGSAFFDNYFVVFDHDKKQIGFAPHA